MAERLGASGVDDDSEKDFSVFSRGISVLVSEIASVSRACNARFTGVERALHERETLAMCLSGMKITDLRLEKQGGRLYQSVLFLCTCRWRGRVESLLFATSACSIANDGSVTDERTITENLLMESASK